MEFSADARSTSKKRPRDEARCVIHAPSCDKDPYVELTQPKNEESMNSLLDAAHIRNYKPLLALDMADVYYHRYCRSLFTMKKSLDALQKKQTIGSPEVGAAAQQARRRSIRGPASPTPVLPAVCIFCERQTKYIKSTKTREPLQQCLETCSHGKVKQCGIDQNHSRILALCSAESLIAREAKYHKSCYIKFTKVATQPEKESMETDGYEQSLASGYSDLFKYIRNEVYDQPRVVSMTDLLKHLGDFIVSDSGNQLMESTKKHFRRKLEAEFGTSLHIFPDESGRLFILPECCSKEDIARENLSLQKQLSRLQSASSNQKQLINAAMAIHKDVKAAETPQPWPPHPHQLTNNIPDSLQIFLSTLLTGGRQENENVTRVIESVGQDIIYSISHGRQKTLKHIIS